MVVRRVTLPSLALGVVAGILLGVGLPWVLVTFFGFDPKRVEWAIAYDSDPERIKLLNDDVLTLEGPEDKAYISFNCPTSVCDYTKNPQIRYDQIGSLRAGLCVVGDKNVVWCPQFNYPDAELGKKKLYSVVKL